MPYAIEGLDCLNMNKGASIKGASLKGGLLRVCAKMVRNAEKLFFFFPPQKAVHFCLLKGALDQSAKVLVMQVLLVGLNALTRFVPRSPPAKSW